MDKETFFWVLQASILSFEGVGETEIMEKLGQPEEVVKIGVKLALYLQGKEVTPTT